MALWLPIPSIVPQFVDWSTRSIDLLTNRKNLKKNKDFRLQMEVRKVLENLQIGQFDLENDD